ncbi:MAG: hypothetical protein AAF773_29700, partial [Cyanobacteria bacterium P01_D01_bin.115]
YGQQHGLIHRSFLRFKRGYDWARQGENAIAEVNRNDVTSPALHDLNDSDSPCRLGVKPDTLCPILELR